LTKPGAAFSELLRSLTKRRATVLYPYEKIDVPADFRGAIEVRDDLCIGCSKCAIACPADAIEMVAEKGEKKISYSGKEIPRKKHPEVNLLSCIRCDVCEEVCPTAPKAIYITERFSGASDKNVILVVPTVP
jgi:formate hydrogenlyase subunit 6/NADH:ubiquinone oxidoreductase subunit I